MLILAANSSENLVATNHFLRDQEPWTPFLGVDNGLNDLNGLLCVQGSNNSVIGNHFSQIIDSQSIRPAGAAPVIIRLMAGAGNFVSNNHVVAMDVQSTASDSCFSAQVDALLTTAASDGLAVTAVMVDSESARNTILDSGSDAQVIADRAVNAFRATPTVGFEAEHEEGMKMKQPGTIR
jgi:inulin fructotransferase (DFA-I-forming)